MPKPMPPTWEDDLLLGASPRGPNWQNTVPVKTIKSGLCVGELFLYLRISPAAVDFSVGLVFQDPDDNKYALIRCNSPSPQTHTNEWPRKEVIVGVPHIHHLTAYYQRQAQRKGARNIQGHTLAIVTGLYSTDIRDAIRVLGQKAHIEAQRSLFT